MKASYRYKARVLRVVDGDTLDVLVDMGFGCMCTQRLRLLGVNTPELRPRKGTAAEKEDEKRRAIQATEYVERVLPNNIIIDTEKDDAFGRYLAEIYFFDSGQWSHLNALLLEKGHAVPYKK